jgi:hypothetical protein
MECPRQTRSYYILFGLVCQLADLIITVPMVHFGAGFANLDTIPQFCIWYNFFFKSNRIRTILFSVNIDGKQGAVGFTSVLFPFVYPVRLIKVNENGDVMRDKNGLCVTCKPGEPGEFVGKIVKGHPSR